jgi:hypothetical protein
MTDLKCDRMAKISGEKVRSRDTAEGRAEQKESSEIEKKG